MQNLPDRIALVGMMGAGKTTIGRLLAGALNYDFVDLDEYIVGKEGRSISSLFESHGRAHFRWLENEALRIFSDRKKLLLSTGGGAPTLEQNATLLSEKYFTLHLRVEPAVAAKRLFAEKSERPLIAACTAMEQVEEVMKTIWEERKAFYQTAHWEVEVSRLSPEEVRDQCLRLFKQTGAAEREAGKN